MILISILFSFLLFVVLPIAAIVWFVRFLMHRGKGSKSARKLEFRDLLIVASVSAAGFCGIIALYYFPLAVFGVTEENSSVFAMRLIGGMVLLLVGLWMKGVTGNFLMSIGIIGFLLAMPFAFDNFGSVGTFALVVAAFIGLIVAALRQSKKHQAVTK